ncbi:MAG TPA: threonine-phosphate decarboxylase CobD [Xanthobacteraceae bacterium]
MSATAMISRSEATPLEHGGDLAAARRLFPDAPQPFIDLSTGINPYPYPLPLLAANVFTQLPDSAAQIRLREIAARTYGAPSATHVVCAPGTQILLPLLATLVPPGRAGVLGPTYSEHARAAALAGHAVMDVRDIDELRAVDLAVVVNPNNPDGRIITKEKLLALSDDLSGRGGLLALDEAFMEVGPPGASLAGEIYRGNIIVLRSFGKFFGLPGLRLGFALAAPALAAKLNAALGPWAVSGPAIAIAEKALGDHAWIDATRIRLASAAGKLDGLLAEASVEVLGGTALFRLVRTRRAHEIFQHLGTAGIIVRTFREQPTWLRFGIPGESGWDRVRSRLTTYGKLAGAPTTA